MTVTESPNATIRTRTPVKTSRVTSSSTPVVRPDIEVIPDAPTTTREGVAAKYVFATTRIALAFVFLWAFVDKLFGFDHATPGAKAWINGGSPSSGFLKGVKGPFAGFFNSIAGTPADYLFMFGLLGIGVALMFGVGMRIAAGSGALLLVFMWMASLPITTNPFLDDHLVYALVIVGLALMHAGDTLGLGKVWSKLAIVKRLPFLR
jgi:thiosulfate dehydrogenase [quinone] large subunit